MQEMRIEEFLHEFSLMWHVGQHVTIVGTTGSGKTVLAESIYEMRRYVVVISTKSKDESLEQYGKDFYRIKRWPPDWHQERVLFWKKPKELGEFGDQRKAVFDVLDSVYRHGNRTVGIDDVVYLVRQLHLKEELAMLYTQARSQGVSLVGNLQRPYWVPLEVCNQASHLLVFGLKDKDDVDRVAEAQGIGKETVRTAIRDLRQYDFAWIRTSREPIIIRHKEK
jgi:hypothetical protein